MRFSRCSAGRNLIPLVSVLLLAPMSTACTEDPLGADAPDERPEEPDEAPPDTLPPRTSYRMAYILVVAPASTPAPEMVARVDSARKAFPAAFSEATAGLVAMDTSEPLAIVVLPASEAASLQAIAKAFYVERPDNVDFLTAFTSGSTAVESMHHTTVRQELDGIGLGRFDLGPDYGSQNALLGINHMTEVDTLSAFDDFLIMATNAVLHETGHEWCCYVGTDFARSAQNEGLQIIQQGIHWYRGLHNPADGSSPMGSDHWVPNGDGTFRRVLPEGLALHTPYHPFVLYLMGVLPIDRYGVEYRVYDAGAVGQTFHPESATLFGSASVEDIIAAEGPWHRRQ